jgi:uncharacterized protein (TIGR02147 family)
MQTHGLNLDTQLEPKVRSYIHIFQYFSDYYNFRKNKDEKFSFEIWSTELGFKSRSQLRMICSGKRNATALVIGQFSVWNKLTQAEENHLHLMSHFYRATSAVQKKIYLDKIMENFESNSYQVETRNYVKFLSHKELPLVQLLLGISDFEGTEKQLQEMLGLSAASVQKYLQILKEIQMVQKVELESKNVSKWVSVTNNFKVSDQPGSEALRLYHRETIQEMEKVLDSNPVMKRFRSIMFTLGEAEFSEFIDETESFLKKMKSRYGAESINDKYIFKLNLNVYPVTEKFKK